VIHQICGKVALTDKEAETTGEAIFNKCICRYGTPLEIESDDSKECRNKLATELYKRLNIEHTTTAAAYHPQCNAQEEVCNKTISKYLNSFVNETTLDWEQYLTLVIDRNLNFAKTETNLNFGSTET